MHRPRVHLRGEAALGSRFPEPTPAPTQAIAPPQPSNAYPLLNYFLEVRFLALVFFALFWALFFFALRFVEALRKGRSSATAAISITRVRLGVCRSRDLAASSCARWMASVTSRMYLAASAS